MYVCVCVQIYGAAKTEVQHSLYVSKGLEMQLREKSLHSVRFQTLIYIQQ